ncbi:hypothetical protein SUGI_0106380 [Cryptomeria japonica]|nr:hypothetical protein SUGI_0106380 [Cryptomeria japonica]
MRSQRKRVAVEIFFFKKRGLGIRLLRASSEDTHEATQIKFASQFEKNSNEKWAAIKASSLFVNDSISMPMLKKLDFVRKRNRNRKGAYGASGISK